MADRTRVNAKLAALGIVRAVFAQDQATLNALLAAAESDVVLLLAGLACNWIADTAERDGISYAEAVADLEMITVDEDDD